MHNKNKNFSIFFFIIIITITLYFITILFKYPLIGISVQQEGDILVVKEVYKNSWASIRQIEEGNLIKTINNKKATEHNTVKNFNRVEMIESLEVVSDSFGERTLYVSRSEREFFTRENSYMIISIIFHLINLGLSIIFFSKIKNEKSVSILIYFLLCLSLSYLSSFASARGDILGRYINIISFPLSIILFLHFLKQYFYKFHLEFLKDRSIKKLYLMYLSVVLISFLLQKFANVNSILQLSFFSFLLFYLLISLTTFYIRVKNQIGNILKILFISLFLAFSPSIVFYALPNILGKEELLSIEITALSLYSVPIAILYLQFTEKIFDFTSKINKLLYNLFISIFLLFINFILLFVFGQNIYHYLGFLILFFVSTFLCLYFKDLLDRKLNNPAIANKPFESIYSYFINARTEIKKDNMISLLMREITNTLSINSIDYIEVKSKKPFDSTVWGTATRTIDINNSQLDEIDWEKYTAGDVFDSQEFFGVILIDKNIEKHVVVCKKKLIGKKLSQRHMSWLKTISLLTIVLLDNVHNTELLWGNLENEVDKNSYPSWFSKLMITLSEKERANLSIDLHDSVLQNLLYLLREVDSINKKSLCDNEISNLKEIILDNIYLIRETCNELRPPFLIEQGIITSLQNLIDRFKLQCNFMMYYHLDFPIHNLDKTFELNIYRIVQELLNNAMKHSNATEVHISLTNRNEAIFLHYTDNGVGMDLTKIDTSFKTIGISGLNERVKSINGEIMMTSKVGEGLKVKIKVKMEDIK